MFLIRDHYNLDYQRFLYVFNECAQLQASDNPLGYLALCSKWQNLFLGRVFFLAVGEWLLMLPRPTSLTAGVAQPLRHIARASSSTMLPNTVLTRSHLGMAEPGFEPTTLWLDIWSGFELHFWPAKVRTVLDGSDRPRAIVSKVGVDALVECKSSYKPQQPQPSSNISLPLAWDYSPCKGGQLSLGRVFGHKSIAVTFLHDFLKQRIVINYFLQFSWIHNAP